MSLSLPLWVIVTALYVVGVGYSIRRDGGSGGYFDADFTGCLLVCFLTMAYMLYWILELAL